MKVRYLFLLICVVGASACHSSPTPSEFISYVPIETENREPLQASSVPLPSGTSAESEKEIASAVENEIENGVAARVNNQPVSLELYNKQVSRFEQTLKAQGIDLTSESGQAVLNQVEQQVLETLIDRLIIEQQAVALDITITEQAVETEIETIAHVQNRAQFEAWLAANSLSFEEFKETLRSQLIAGQVFESVTGTVSEATEKEQIFNDWLLKQRSAAVIERYVAFGYR